MKMKKSLLTTAILASLTLTACGGGSSSSSDPDPVVPPANTAPTDIALSNDAVDENAMGALVGTLSATDAEGGAMTFSTDSEMFVIDGDQLSLATDYTADYEAATSMTLNVSVSDADGASFSKELTVNITDVLDTYTFDSKFMDGSSVSYTGQIARHVLIAELNNFIANIKDWLDANPSASKDDVLVELNKFYDPSEATYETLPITFTDAQQTLIADISSSLKTISGKVAGNDPGGQEKDWNGGDFAGWGAKGSTTPEALVLSWFDMLADNAVAYNTGIEMDSVYVTATGLDLKQLIQKHLLMAVTYSQATGDYLGEETDGKGLTTQNTAGDKDGEKAYSTLEHQFDEGFGYLGASVDYLSYTDDEISSKGGRDEFQGKHDTNADGVIDLTSEFNFGASVNAAKRDRGATIATDFTKDIMEAFLQGRKIINDAAGAELSDDEMAALIVQRDIAVEGWEKAIAATVIHYINDTSADLDTVGTEDFNFSDLAKHWSEMKGFALGLQFSPYSKLTDAQFEQLHVLLKDAPVFDEAAPVDIATYKADLLTARDILTDAIGFEADNAANW